MFCKNCGNELDDETLYCPKCGAKVVADVAVAANEENKSVEKQTAIITKENTRAVWSVGRLVVGLFAIVLFAVMVFQAIGAVVVIVQQQSSASGFETHELFAAVFMLVGGIVGVATRKSYKIGGCIATGIVFLGATVLAALDLKSRYVEYVDMKIWVIVGLAFAIFYIICAVMQKKRNAQTD